MKLVCIFNEEQVKKHFYLWFFPPLCLVAEATLSRSDMAEQLSRQLEDILSTYCRDASALPNGQSHSPELNGLTGEREGDKAEKGKVNGGHSGMEKEPKKTQEKKKVKGLGKEKLAVYIRISWVFAYFYGFVIQPRCVVVDVYF